MCYLFYILGFFVLFLSVHVNTWHNKKINSLSRLMQMSSTVNFLPFSSNFILAWFTAHVVAFASFLKSIDGTSLVVQWLRLCISTTVGLGLIPGQGTKILQAV